SDPNDVKALSDKFQSLWDIGVRTFAIPLDDISYTQWNCDADREMFGTGPAAAGAAQSYLLNAVQRDFIATHPGSGRLEMVPTEYADVDSTPYKSVLAARLDPAVLVEWTGVGVIAPVITGAQADAAKQVFGHDILVWDNYPVNDYIPGQLLLGPYVGRDPGLPSLLVGITANPMAQAAASKVALFTVADYAWNSRGYDAQRSWNASLAELAGGNDATLSALTAFADVNYASPLDKTQAPELSPKITDFWRSWPDGVIRAALPLRRAFDQLHDAPAVLRASLPDKDFLAETSLWLDATQTWALAADTATDMLIAQWEGDLVRAWADRLAVIDLVRAARSISYVGLDGKKHPVLVGQGVIDTFVADALAENAKAFNAQRTALTPSTSMSAYQSYVPANMVDGDPATYYWSSRAVRTGDTVGVDLGSAEQVGDIVVLMSKSDSVDDYMHSGVVEHSVDGSEWTVARSFAGTQQVAFSPPASTTARHVRLRATADQPNWLVVREFTVTTSVVTGGPEPAPGSRLSAVVDGNVDSAYVAARAPSGETLTIALPAPLPVTRVVVLCSAGRGHVETGTNDVWSAIGDLGGGYTAFSLPGAPVDAIRLVWSPDSPAPVVHEVIAT
ncbi:MAG: beta-N-acetylglucosaminidase domain-containing protein, partial [Kutzneria sp.]|nr:beta-N-acetylglucosaminidase domain-containing protein [Kutzneria sp.]